MKKLNLGSGHDYRDGWTNVDINPDFNPDVVINLETPDWDLPTDEYDVVLVDNVFEHIDPRKRPVFLIECHRVCHPDGKVVMRWPTPGFGGGWDVTHYCIPSWEWPEHTNHEDAWEIIETDFNYNRLGWLLPDRIANQLMWLGIRTVLSVELTITPSGEYEETW
jgi:predicted SAM-dependent methyltransferase